MASEVETLANPAFCGALLTQAITGFVSADETGMPVSLSFLVLPLVLPGRIRDELPSTTSTKLHAWVQAKPEIKMQFSGHAESLTAQTRAGLRFALAKGTCQLQGDRLVPGKKLKANGWDATAESKACLSKSTLVGKWLAKAGDESTVYSLLGVRP